MKYTASFSFLICFLLISLISCEKVEIQKSTFPGSQIQQREIVECNECPMGDCCCAVWLQDQIFGYADLYICGTTDGIENCSGEATGGCSSFSGGGQELELIGNDTPRRGFCIEPGEAFWIANIGGSPAYIYVTCQYDQTGPQTLQLTIPATSRVYIGSNGECEIDPC